MYKRFNKAVLWNYASLLFMAASGFIMNTVISIAYGAEALGVFNETYAWYMILSQISVWGIHMAMVKFVPETDSNAEKGTIFRTGLLLGIIISFIITILSELFTFFFDNYEWQKSMQIAFLGLMLFTINKIMINYLNAIYKMIPYAFFTSLRYGCFGIFICIISFSKTDYLYLALVFPFTEIAVFVLMILYFRIKLMIEGKIDLSLIKKIVVFGTSILPSYMVLELNTKVDIICLGFLLNDSKQIGVYSFAILFTEGFYMMYIVLRRMINPSLSEANVKGKLEEFLQIKYKEIAKYLNCGGLFLLAVIVLVFYLMCTILAKRDWLVGDIYIGIIGVSILINNKSIVFGDVLAQAGFPREESELNVITILANFILNIILISLIGTSGAAFATAISYFAYRFYMRYKVKKKMGVYI